MLSVFNAVTYSIKVGRILLKDYGYFRTARTSIIHNHSGYQPWFTYPAIEQLDAWDLSDKSVLEYGSGYSTLYWAVRTKSVVSIEADRDWYKRIASLVPANVDLQLRALDYYCDAKGEFDIIVIDGYARARTRYKCAASSLPCLNIGGLVIVDNSDWLPATCSFLRDSGLIQVDFSGFVPGNPTTQTTSFFLSKEFRFRHSQQLKPIGGRGYNWEPKLEQELLGDKISSDRDLCS